MGRTAPAQFLSRSRTCPQNGFMGQLEIRSLNLEAQRIARGNPRYTATRVPIRIVRSWLRTGKFCRGNPCECSEAGFRTFTLVTTKSIR